VTSGRGTAGLVAVTTCVSCGRVPLHRRSAGHLTMVCPAGQRSCPATTQVTHCGFTSYSTQNTRLLHRRSSQPHINPFNCPLSRTTWVSRYQKGKPIWILLKQETVSGSGISWAICKSAPRSKQTTMPAPHCSVFTGQMPFLLPNQQCQSIEGNTLFPANNFENKPKNTKTEWSKQTTNTHNMSNLN